MTSAARARTRLHWPPSRAAPSGRPATRRSSWRADGTVRQLGAGGIALGGTADPRLDERHVLLGHGDTMLLYTNGVTEARRDGECFGETRLYRLPARIGRWELAGVAELVERAALQFSRPDECDDIAVLVLRVE
ncbi:MAG TPA: SpoIIE family protein phosphatase [Trebonia sp.]